ncbi:hypothetical protein [Jidongwangia harbinensis]|uniref:hypothetical protein n=1 Tax=Jidongwangia harbinensis TaxID=2878561 RepID=UPI001CDA1F1D|nr:hypothetical protein [Jidongwangia harbinensis]MCA2216280.1 hypothetical protein [Jidongwangia harbinensis]MCA2217015.1 hypothetical protein [Jidongwangia harbinensis]
MNNNRPDHLQRNPLRRMTAMATAAAAAQAMFAGVALTAGVMSAPAAQAKPKCNGPYPQSTCSPQENRAPTGTETFDQQGGVFCMCRVGGLYFSGHACDARGETVNVDISEGAGQRREGAYLFGNGFVEDDGGPVG